MSERALRLSIFINEGHLWHHKPMSSEIVHRAHQAGLAGATVMRGVEGYGSNARIHTQHPFRLGGEDLPLVITIADEEDRVRAFLPQVQEVLNDGLVVLDDIEIVRFADHAHQEPLPHR